MQLNPELKKLLRTYLIAGIAVIGFTLTHFSAKSQTLFTYGSKQASSAGFVRAFNKNPGDGDRKKAMEEYLPLYINYVLKVQDAYDMRLDTLASQKNELLGYKVQLAESYINEKAGANAMVDESIARMQQDVWLGHIYIAYGKDTTAAFSQAQQAYNQLKAGKAWGDVAQQFSTDPGLQSNKGIAGWMTAMVIPYNYETAVYALPKGGYTTPIKGSEGVHIFSKREVRPAVGKVEVAQILIADLPSFTEADRKQKAKLADSVYQLLKNGGNFSQQVAQFSQDRSSNQSGGVLPAFGIGTFDPAFEKAAYALQKPGDISPPVSTSMGWHILQLKTKILPPSKEDAAARADILQQLTADGKMEKASENYLRKQLPAIGYKAPAIPIKNLQRYTDSLLANGNTAVTGLTEKSPLFSFTKQRFTLSDWIAYARVQSMSGSLAKGADITKAYDEFLLSKASDYLPAHLDEVDGAFAEQFKEFKDANLLFEAMERNVWSKATSDTLGLKKYYEAHKEKYIWGDNVAAILVTTADSLIAVEACNKISQRTADWRSLNDLYEGKLFADSGRYEINLLPNGAATHFSPGQCTAPERNETDGSYSFAYVLAKGQTGLQRSFDEARGFVAGDYQQVLEDAWIARLKKKYPVKMNDVEWKKVLAK
jgi:peptidyl-prolyl cis-trans isomerase SurA